MWAAFEPWLCLYQLGASRQVTPPLCASSAWPVTWESHVWSTDGLQGHPPWPNLVPHVWVVHPHTTAAVSV